MKPAAIIPLIVAFLLGLLSRRGSLAAPHVLMPPAEDEQKGAAAPAAADDGGPSPNASGFVVRLYGFLKEHFWFVSLVTTALAAFLVIVKALFLAEGDLSTATILLADGVQGIALSAFIASLPFMALGAVATAALSLAQVRSEGASLLRPAIVLIVALAFALATTPWWWLGATAATVGCVLCLVYLKFKKPGEGTRISDYGWPGLWFLAVIGVLSGAVAGQLITLDRMWIPAESILIQKPSADPARLVGYVISDEGSYLTVLIEEDRSLTYLKANEVIERTRCQLEPEWSELPLPSAIWGGDGLEYPWCSNVVSTTPGL